MPTSRASALVSFAGVELRVAPGRPRRRWWERDRTRSGTLGAAAGVPVWVHVPDEAVLLYDRSTGLLVN